MSLSRAAARLRRAVTRGPRPPADPLAVTMPVLRELLAADPAAIDQLAAPSGVTRIRLGEAVLDLDDRGHRALWRLVLATVAPGPGSPGTAVLVAPAPRPDPADGLHRPSPAPAQQATPPRSPGSPRTP